MCMCVCACMLLCIFVWVCVGWGGWGHLLSTEKSIQVTFIYVNKFNLKFKKVQIIGMVLIVF